MLNANNDRLRQQLRFLQRQFLQDGDASFSAVLSEDVVSRALTAVGVCWTDRIYSPRPDRYEPRLKKHRRNNYDYLTKPRGEMKRKMAKGII